MFPPSFDYHRAGSVSEALSLLAELPDATLLAGGHALLPDLKNGRAEPGAVVDVSELPELTGVEVDGDAVVVGAGTTYADLLRARTDDTDAAADAGESVLDTYAPAFAAATRAVGDRQIRNRGTVGGNLAEAHPDSDLPAAALVADASVRIRGPDGEREVAVSEFLTGPFESAVDGDEIVTGVRIPRLDRETRNADGGGAYVKKTHPTSGYAMVGVAARVTVADGVISSTRVAANGVAETVLRLPGVETALAGIDTDGTDADERVSTAAEDAAADVPKSVRRGDVHASAEYRVNVLSTYVERTVGAAVEEATADGSTGPDSADSGAADPGGEQR